MVRPELKTGSSGNSYSTSGERNTDVKKTFAFGKVLTRVVQTMDAKNSKGKNRGNLD
jgi:hypothetical protein